MKKAINVFQLTVNYGKNTALWDVNLSIPEGKLVALVGPNGAGKSTLLKAILGLIKPHHGGVQFFEEPLQSKKRCMDVGYMPQKESIDWDFPISLSDFVLMGCYGRLSFFGRPKKEDHLRVDRMLNLLELKEVAHRQINQLSGGQKQRAILARSLIQDAKIYLWDEPFSNIDLATLEIMVQKLLDLKKEGKTVLVVHHDLATVADLFDWVILLNIRLVASGEMATTFTPELLQKTFNKERHLFEKALRLTQEKKRGL